MSSTEREPVADAASSSTLAVEPGASAIRPSRFWTYILLGGIVAGVVSWLAGEACMNVVEPRRHAIVDRGMALSVTDRRGEATANSLNAGLAFMLMGASLGGALGLVGGCVRGSKRAAGSAAARGAGAGAVGAALASLAFLPAYDAFRLGNPDAAARDLVLPLLVHVGVWGVVGAAAGLALGVGLGLGDRRAILKVVVGGLVGAAVGAVVFEIVGALAIPAAETARYVSKTASSRLFARLAVCILAALGAGIAALDARGRSSGLAV